MSLWARICGGLKAAWQTYDGVNRYHALERLEWETEELENIFSILTLGAFVGLPSPPMQLTLDLLPLMERELEIMSERVATAHDPLAELFSLLEAT